MNFIADDIAPLCLGLEPLTGSCWLSGFVYFVEPPLRWEDFLVCVFIRACCMKELRCCFSQHNRFFKCEVKICRSLLIACLINMLRWMKLHLYVMVLRDGNNGVCLTNTLPPSPWDTKRRSEQTIKGDLTWGGSMWPGFLRIGFGGELLWPLKNSTSTINVQFLDHLAIVVFLRTLRHEVS
jgi:hypothetical protein